MALLDEVKKSLTEGYQLPQFGQSERIKKMQAAQSGMTALGAAQGPKQRSVQETVAAATAQQQQKETILEGQLAAFGLEQQARQQQQEFEQKEALVDEETLNIRQQMQNKTQDILQDFSQRKGEIEFKEENARVQYAMLSMRLSNDDYLDSLEVEGARSRLDDQTAFEWELAQTMFADELELFNNDLDFKRMMNADDRTWKEYLKEFELDQSIQISGAKIEAAESRAGWQAVGQVLSAGTQALSTAAQSGWLTPKPTYTTQSTGSSNLGALRESENTSSLSDSISADELENY